jgi:hypothetical protein
MSINYTIAGKSEKIKCSLTERSDALFVIYVVKLLMILITG